MSHNSEIEFLQYKYILIWYRNQHNIKSLQTLIGQELNLSIT